LRDRREKWQGSALLIGHDPFNGIYYGKKKHNAKKHVAQPHNNDIFLSLD